MKTMTVGRVAEVAGIGVETVRFYEKSGLLEKPHRRASGYREYDGQAVKRLRFIQRAKDLGFTLTEIKELLSLRSGSDRPCEDVRAKAEAKIAEIGEKIALLLRMNEVLGRLASSCGGRGDGSRCPILESLEGGEATGGRSDGDDDGGPLSGQRDQRQEGRPGDPACPRAGRVRRSGPGRR